jgi:hypothetical protein
MFRGILFGATPPVAGADSRPEPAFFHDLNLDQVTAWVTAGLGDYRLEPFFYTPLAGRTRSPTGMRCSAIWPARRCWNGSGRSPPR